MKRTMEKFFAMIVFVVAISGNVNAQSFERTFGTSANETGRTVVLTSDSGFGLLVNRGNTFDIIKTDSLGNIQWQNNHSYGFTWGASCLINTLDGGFAVVGQTQSGTYTGGKYAVGLVVKFNASGVYQWHSVLSGSSSENGGSGSICQNSNGEYVVFITIQGHPDFGGSNYHGSIIKLSATGSIMWSHAINNTCAFTYPSILCDGLNYFIAGGINGVYGYTNYGGNAFLAKYNNDGTQNWIKNFSYAPVLAGNRDNFNAFCKLSTGEFVLAGSTTSGGITQKVIVKTDPLGNMLWQKFYGDSISINSIKESVNGSICCIGSTTRNATDLILNYINPIDGSFIWSSNLGGVNSDYGTSLISLPSSNNIVLGTTSSIGAGGSDAWLLKLTIYNYLTTSSNNTCSGQPVTLSSLLISSGVNTNPANTHWTGPGVDSYSNPITVYPTSTSTYWCAYNGSNQSVTITVNPVPDAAGTITGTTTVCQGQSSVTYTVPAITNATSYTWTLPTGVTGTSTTNSITVSYGTSAVSGNITVKGNNACGSGTVSTLAITVKNSTSSTISETVCDSYTAPDGIVYTTSGIKTAVIPNAVGCDSTITINLTVKNSSTSSITETVCDSYTAPDGIVYTTSGIKTAVIPNAVGCDSTITINLTVKQSTTGSIAETVCDSYTAPDGIVYTTSGIKTAVIPNAVGCDSTITINLTVKNSTTSSITESVCDSYTAPDGIVYTTSGIKTAVIPNAVGCDSTITINLTVKNSSTSSITETVCDSYTAPDGIVYTTSGIKTAVIPNAAGCDSTITINLTVKQSTTGSIAETVCDSYTAPDGIVYTTSGIKTAVIPNAAGCDSTITINLTVKQSTTSSITEAVCNSYTAPDGIVYTTSGIKTAVIPNAVGCDSTITINLTILNSTSSTEIITACNSYTWSATGLTYTTGGTYNTTLMNNVGCDSLTTLNLTISIVTISLQPSDQTVLLGDNAQFTVSITSPSPTYQWQTDLGVGFQNMTNSGQYSGVTTNTLTVSNAAMTNNNQQFRCIVSSQSCQDTTTVATLTVTDDTGVDNDLSSGIKVYPNPVSNELIIESANNSNNISFEILNSIGQKVFGGNVKNKIIVPTTDFAPGVYILRLENGEFTEFRKVVKE